MKLIGDVHGKFHELKDLVEKYPDDNIVQVGDMGVGFHQLDYWHEQTDNWFLEHNLSFIRGNHDNPSRCKTMESWIPDGKVHNDIMYIGGAWSIDYRSRIPGMDWWHDEELSYGEFNKLIEIYSLVKPSIMITHDCPASVSQQLFIDRGLSFSNISFNTITNQAFQYMFKLHQPKIWVFGHWHYDVDEVINGTRFVCLDELSIVDLNTSTFKLDFLQDKKGGINGK